MRERLIQEFEAALYGAWNDIERAAKYYSTHAKKNPETFYIRDTNFRFLVTKNRSRIDDLAREIDTHINQYCRDALATYAKDHDAVMKKYREIEGIMSTDRLESIHGRPVPAHINQMQGIYYWQ